MAPVALWFIAFGLADIVAGFSGRPQSPRRLALGTIVAATVVGLLCLSLGYPPRTIAVTVALMALSVTGWMLLRLPMNWTATRALTTLLLFMSSSFTVALATPIWNTPTAAAAKWLSNLPYKLLQGSYDRLLFATGALLFLLATCNAIVRLILAIVNEDLEPRQQRLRGGRIIGALERILIFTLALAGEVTAAGLVISAKSLLRFPEISQIEKESIDSVTEYFLVGSLSSWLLALVLVPLLVS